MASPHQNNRSLTFEDIYDDVVTSIRRKRDKKGKKRKKAKKSPMAFRKRSQSVPGLGFRHDLVEMMESYPHKASALDFESFEDWLQSKISKSNVSVIHKEILRIETRKELKDSFEEFSLVTSNLITLQIAFGEIKSFYKEHGSPDEYRQARILAKMDCAGMLSEATSHHIYPIEEYGPALNSDKIWDSWGTTFGFFEQVILSNSYLYKLAKEFGDVAKFKRRKFKPKKADYILIEFQVLMNDDGNLSSCMCSLLPDIGMKPTETQRTVLLDTMNSINKRRTNATALERYLTFSTIFSPYILKIYDWRAKAGEISPGKLRRLRKKYFKFVEPLTLVRFFLFFARAAHVIF